MAEVVIILRDKVTGNCAVTPDEGKPILDQILASFAEGKSVLLDFTGLTLCTTAFLNVVIGNLYKNYKSEQLKTLLSLEGLDDSLSIRIKKVTDNAKVFYQNEARFNKVVGDAIYGNN